MRRPEPALATAETATAAPQAPTAKQPEAGTPPPEVPVHGGTSGLPFPTDPAPQPISADQSVPRHDPVEAPAIAAPASASAAAAADEFIHYPDEGYVPPVRARRNPAKLWTIAAILFFLFVSAVGGALAYFGPPSWLAGLGMGTRDQEAGLNFYLPKPPERRNLPTGEEYFAFSARILNDSDHELAVPPVVVELRDEQGRLVFSWMTKADKSRLKPSEEARVSESRLDIPKNARNLELRFVDSGR